MILETSHLSTDLAHTAAVMGNGEERLHAGSKKYLKNIFQINIYSN